MRPLASIYSHRVPEFMETQVGFNPNQKMNSNPKRKLQPRLSVDRPVGRPMPRSPARSTAPTREQGHFSRSTGSSRPLLSVHARACRSTGPVDRPPPPVDRDIDREHKLPAPWAVPCSFVVRSLCYLLPSPPSPLSPLSQQVSCAGADICGLELFCFVRKYPGDWTAVKAAEDEPVIYEDAACWFNFKIMQNIHIRN